MAHSHQRIGTGTRALLLLLLASARSAVAQRVIMSCGSGYMDASNNCADKLCPSGSAAECPAGMGCYPVTRLDCGYTTTTTKATAPETTKAITTTTATTEEPTQPAQVEMATVANEAMPVESKPAPAAIVATADEAQPVQTAQPDPVPVPVSETLRLCGSDYADATLCALAAECPLGDALTECPMGYDCFDIPALECVTAEPTMAPVPTTPVPSRSPVIPPLNVCAFSYEEAVESCNNYAECMNGDKSTCPNGEDCWSIPVEYCFEKEEAVAPATSPAVAADEAVAPVISSVLSVCATSFMDAKVKCVDPSKDCSATGLCDSDASEACFRVAREDCEGPVSPLLVEVVKEVIGDPTVAVAQTDTPSLLLFVCGLDYDDAQDNICTNESCSTVNECKIGGCYAMSYVDCSATTTTDAVVETAEPATSALPSLLFVCGSDIADAKDNICTNEPCSATEDCKSGDCYALIYGSRHPAVNVVGDRDLDCSASTTIQGPPANTIATTNLATRETPACSFCPQGLAAPGETPIPNSGGQDCESFLELAPSLNADEHLCDASRQWENLCCPSWLAPTNAPIVNTLFCGADDNDGLSLLLAISSHDDDGSGGLSLQEYVDFLVSRGNVGDGGGSRHVDEHGHLTRDFFIRIVMSYDELVCGGEELELAGLLDEERRARLCEDVTKVLGGGAEGTSESDDCPVCVDGLDFLLSRGNSGVAACCLPPAEDPCTACPVGITVDGTTPVTDEWTCDNLVRDARLIESTDNVCESILDLLMKTCCPEGSEVVTTDAPVAPMTTDSPVASPVAVSDAPTPPLVWSQTESGCPSAYVYGESYEPTEKVSVAGATHTEVYECAAAPNNQFCGEPGYEPGKSQFWQTVWTALGSCSGSISPTASPNFSALTDAGGCPEEWEAGVNKYKENDKISKNGLVFQCAAFPYSGFCGQTGYEPMPDDGTEHWKDAWTAVGYCRGTISPNASPAFGRGCPEEWVSGTNTAYKEGDMVSITVSTSPLQKIAYTCKAWPFSGFCGLYAPNLGLPDDQQGWTMNGGCTGTIAPNSVLSSFGTLNLVTDGCPRDYDENNLAGIKAGDQVSLVVSAAPTERRVVYECKSGAVSAYCTNPAFIPGGQYSATAWDFKGYCDGTIAPTTSPTAYVNAALPAIPAECEQETANGMPVDKCYYEKDITTTGVSCTCGDVDCPNPTRLANTSTACKKDVIVTHCPSVEVYSPSVIYEDGDVVRIGAKKFQCKAWPYYLRCSDSAYEPSLDSEVWTDAWSEIGNCPAIGESTLPTRANPMTAPGSSKVVTPDRPAPAPPVRPEEEPDKEPEEEQPEPTPPAPGPVDGCRTLDVSMTLDQFPADTRWEVVSAGGDRDVLAAGGPYPEDRARAAVGGSVCLEPGTYEFRIFDDYGDGICCDWGEGSYSLSFGGTVVIEGGAFGLEETTAFSTPDTQQQPPAVDGNGSDPTPKPTLIPTEEPTFSPTMGITPSVS